MAATTRLIVFNEALREIGSHPLANTSTANVRLQELDGSFDHAVEYILSRMDWNFARRRATLTGVADTSFTPFTFRYARPSDYLRKTWVKTTASDNFQVEHTEIAAAIYGFNASVLMEYISDHADNYEPANWPPQFTRCISIYLALLVGPKLARTGAEEAGGFYQKLDRALDDADRQESLYSLNAAITANRLPIMRRAIEFLGQSYTGSTSLYEQSDKLRYAMNSSWSHALSYTLERGAWNFAAKRAVFLSGAAGDDYVPTDTYAGIIEGYSVGPATGEDVPISGFSYAYELPDDFRHKLWIKAHPNHNYECNHQRMGRYMLTDADPAIMEYVAENDDTRDPANWPAVFVDVIAAQLALSVADSIIVEQGNKGAKVSANGLRQGLEILYNRKLQEAKNADAMQQQAKSIPHGRFVQSRLGSIGTTSIRKYN